ncbi:HNH endonuclease signature motif containing protein [Nocardioides sp. GXZ039]|uniref:HNH endonuclease signature motif containing protein n=1 Tax=Nocardioides sp. GXZ039 TaxID=3136018 RepID=UPI0030F448DC
MAATTNTGTGHPLAVLVARFKKDLAGHVDTPLWSLDADDTAALLVDLAEVTASLAELEARAVTQAEALDLPGTIGARSVSTWLRRLVPITPGHAHRTTRLAHELATYEQTRIAAAEGRVLPDQAAVIVAAVDELDPEHRDLAEKHLIAEAAHHDAKALKLLGRRILEVVDPARADEHEARLLEAEEARARKQTSFSMYDDDQGLTHGRFTLPAAQGSMLRKALTALAAPKHVRATDGAGSYDYAKPTPQKLGQAFAEYVERFPTEKLPKAGGLNATVIVTMQLDTLLGGLEAAHLDTGIDISPGQARRLACEAGIIPAVLGSRSEVLDLGRTRRFHSPAQRHAIGLEQQHCQTPGCDTPAAYCHVHHTHSWQQGGDTNTRDARLHCPFHHHQLHATGQAHPMRA